MKKKLIAAVGTVFILIIFCAPSVYALGFGAQARLWVPTFEGDLRVDNGSTTGTEVDVKDDLGMDDEYFPVVEAFWGIGNHEITVSYSMIELSGDKNIEKDIVFAGETYHVNDDVESELTTSMIDLEYQYKFLDLENFLAGFSLGLIGKLKYLDGEASIRSSANDDQQDFQIPVPMIGLGVHVGILADILEAHAKVAGMGYDSSFVYDAMAEVSVTPFPFLDITGGYRIMSLKIDDIDDIYTKMDFYGPYVGLSISF